MAAVVNPTLFFHSRLYKSQMESQIILFWSKGMYRKKHFSAIFVHSIHFCTESPFRRMHLCHRSRSLKIPPITPFQQFVNNDVRLPGPLPSSHCSVHASDTLLTKTDGRPWVTRRCVPLGFGVGGLRSQAINRNPRHARRSSVGRAFCCRVMCFIPRPVFRSARGSCWTVWRWAAALLPLVANLDHYVSFRFSRDSSHTLMGSGHCFWLLFLGGRCFVILCLVVLLPDQSDETSLRHPARHCEEICRSLQHTVTGTVREHCFTEVCSTAASEESSGQKLSCVPPSRGPHAASLQFLLSFAWLSLVDDLRWAHPFSPLSR